MPAADALKARLRTLLPDREFIMRSQGQVRFIKVTTRVQALTVLVTIVVISAWLAAMVSLTMAHWSSGRERAALSAREARVASAENEVATYREQVSSVASDLARRQDFIQRMVEAHLGDLPEAPQATETHPSTEGQPGSDTPNSVALSAALPEAGELKRIEAKQFAFVERLTRYADRRIERSASAIRGLGLNPAAMIASNRVAEGGPLLRLATSRSGAIDPRFQRMGFSLARMDALASGLDSLPQVQPAQVAYVSSSYGYRADPFDGSPAFHAGLDFPGPHGSAIYAAADGKVTFSGTRQGYGNCIEITHSNGLLTRYAHLSHLIARVGHVVEAGARIGSMGSTGRSTGPHLHFEVRINDRPVNPRLFLEAARRAQQTYNATNARLET